MSTAPRGGQPSPQEFKLPDGRRVIASSPRDLDLLRRKYANSKDLRVELVVLGSEEHANYLRQSRQHHERRREEFRKRHGPHFDEWEDVHLQLSSVTTQLHRLSTQASALSGNFEKFGYDARLRTYDGGDEAESRAVSAEENDAETGGDRPTETIRLFRKPVMKQWFHRGLIWRGSKPTEIMALELFFDLVYAGIIHDNGVRMSAEPTGRMLLRFAVTFLMSWKIWADVTLCLSWFETNDIRTRVEILFEIACLMAFTSNIYHCFDKNPADNTYLQLVAFYLAARLFTGLRFASVAYMLPTVRGVMLATVVEIVVPSALWMASIHVPMPERLALIWPAIVLDMYAYMFTISMIRFSRGPGRDTGLGAFVNRHSEFYPAINIEHRVERTKAFVSLVSGYSVVGVLFQSAGGYFVNAFLGKAVLAMVQAFVFNWIYFDVDSKGIKVHAIRRSTNTAFVWQFAHLVAIMGYVVSTSAISALVLAADVPNADPRQLAKAHRAMSVPHLAQGSPLFYCHGLAVALLFMGVISLTHEHRQPANLRCRKRYRLANRAAVCLVLFLLPLARSLRSLHLISISLGLSAWVLMFELWGKTCKGQPFIGG